jgi:signal peptidase
VLRTAGTLVVVALLTAVLAGGALGQPVLLGFVETDSMEPALSPGDGFVAVPAAVTPAPERGDVVVYDARELHGGGLVTHRVVGTRGDGYVTRGDANPFTDQDNVEPPVSDGQIVAEALQVGGGVVVLPHLGTAVTTVRETVDHARDRLVDATGLPIGDGQTLLRGMAIAGVVAILLSEGNGDERRTRDRDRSTGRRRGVDPRWVALGVAAVLVAGPTVGAVAASGTQTFGVVADPADETTVDPGGTKQGAFVLHNAGVVPMEVRVDAPPAVTPSVSVTRLGGGESLNATVTLAVPDRPGAYQWDAGVRWYPVLFPRPVTDALFGIHPWLPLVTVDLVVGVTTYLVSRKLLGAGRIRLEHVLGESGQRSGRR